MPSLLQTLVLYELPMVSPYKGPSPSRLPTQVTSEEPLDKTSPDTSSAPGLLMSIATNVIPNTSSYGPCIVSNSVYYETPHGSPSPGPTPSRLP